MNTKHHQYGQIVIRQIGDSLCENFRIGISSQVYNIFRYIMYLGWWKSLVILPSEPLIFKK